MAKCSTAIAKNISRRLRELDLSQAELARQVGQSSAYVSQIIREANQSPSIDNLEKIAAALKVTLAELVSDPDEFKELTAHSDLDCWERVGQIWTALNEGRGKQVLADLRKGIKRDPRSGDD